VNGPDSRVGLQLPAGEQDHSGARETNAEGRRSGGAGWHAAGGSTEGACRSEGPLRRSQGSRGGGSEGEACDGRQETGRSGRMGTEGRGGGCSLGNVTEGGQGGGRGGWDWGSSGSPGAAQARRGFRWGRPAAGMAGDPSAGARPWQKRGVPLAGGLGRGVGRVLSQRAARKFARTGGRRGGVGGAEQCREGGRVVGPKVGTSARCASGRGGRGACGAGAEPSCTGVRLQAGGHVWGGVWRVGGPRAEGAGRRRGGGPPAWRSRVVWGLCGWGGGGLAVGAGAPCMCAGPRAGYACPGAPAKSHRHRRPASERGVGRERRGGGDHERGARGKGGGGRMVGGKVCRRGTKWEAEEWRGSGGGARIRVAH